MKKIKLLLLGGALCASGVTTNAQNGVTFDGVDDVITTNYPGISGNNARTIEAWVKAPLTTNQVVITDWGTLGTGTRFTFNLLNGMLRLEVQGSGQTGTTLVADNTWHHIAVTYDNQAAPNKFSMFIDGTLEMAFNLPTPVNTGSSVSFQIGSRIDLVRHFVGTIDEVKVWDHARTQTQIFADMNTEYCNVPNGMVAYHKLNNGTAGGTNTGVTTSQDDSGLGNNGTLVGFALAGATSNWVTGKALGTTAVSGSQTLSGCDGYTTVVNGNTYSSTGTYTDTLIGASFAGCDSIVTTNLTVAATINVATTTAGSVITASATGASYQWLDCNNNYALLPGETGQSYTATTNGDYAVEVTVGNCKDTSACENITIIGIDDKEFNASIKVFPNPTKGKITLSITNLFGTAEIDVLDIIGKSVMEMKSTNANTVLDLSHLNNGIYFIHVVNNRNKKIIKLFKL